MSVDTRHPLYLEHDEDWNQMRDTYRGQRVVKEKGVKYLPMTQSMIDDGAQQNVKSGGFKQYDAYRRRAVYPEHVKQTVEDIVGMMHQKPATIELPAGMEDMRERATLRNESLQVLLRRINEEQLITGRAGILADVIDMGERAGSPYIAFYEAQDIINWDEGQRSRGLDERPGSGEDIDMGIEPQNLNFVSLDESGPERVREFEWEEEQKFRVLILGNAITNEPEGDGIYRVGVFRDNKTTFSEAELTEPQIQGQSLDEIPFVFINTKDIVPEPDEPPLLGLSNLTLTIYRGEADYRQALFMQGQDTLFVKGVSDTNQKYQLGAGASITVSSTEADAKFIGVDSSGLSEMRQALENDYGRADRKSGDMRDTTSREAESGDALRVRVGTRTASLNQIALTGATALEMLLKIVARWMRLNPDEVVVTPNLDFVEDRLDSRTLVEYMTSKTMGAPISLDTIHFIMQQRGLTEKSFEEEIEAIQNEMELELGRGSSDEDGPEEDEPEPDDDDQEEDDDDEDGDSP